MLPGYTNADHSMLARRLAKTWCKSGEEPEQLASRRVPARSQARPARLRIGYLSGDFKRHPCNQMMCPVFEQHDKSRFELRAFDNSRDDASPERKRVLATFDQVQPTRTLGDQALAAAIRGAGIDVLVDLSGHTSDNRAGVLALRPAPLQISWLGYPGGLGSTLVDYLITDIVCAPSGAEVDFDEALIRLPVSDRPGGERLAADLPTPTRASQGLPDDALVLACFNQHCKFSADTLALWAELLREAPGSVLWLCDEGEVARLTLQAALGRHGVDAARLHWAARLAPLQHVARIVCADLVLDTHPYTMHTTAVDAINVGVPYLTYAGSTLASRVSASLLHTAGLADCVCSGAEDYSTRMVALIHRPEELARLRQRFVAARQSSPLFDARRFVGYLEQAYDTAHARWRAGQAPAAIHIAA